MNDEREEPNVLNKQIQKKVAEITSVKQAADAKSYSSFLKPSFKEEEAAPPLWLITFADIMALMLTFFVLLYSMSVPKEDAWNKMTQGISNSITAFKPPEWYEGAQDTVSIDKIEMKQALNLGYLQTLVKTLRAENKALAKMEIIQKRERIILSLPLEELLDQDKDSQDINLEGKRALFSLGGALSRIRNRIEIVGVTPEVTQWKDQLDRYLRVATVLNDVGYDRPIIVRSQSDDMGLEQEKADMIYIIIMPDSGQKSPL